MPPNPELSVVLPAYEEAANLEKLLPALHQSAAALRVAYDILVIDAQQPRDETPEICRKNGVRYVPRGQGPLYGHAVRTALEEARGQWVIFMDSDGSHNPSFLPKLWEQRHTADLVIASRYVQGGKTENPAVLIFLSLMVNVAFRLALRLKCHDVSNSFRLYRGDDLRALRLQCNHFDIVEEILVKLAMSHPRYRIREIPFAFEKRKAGKTKRSLLLFAFGYIDTLTRLMKMKYEFRAQRV
ncbi:MAG: glycosyltransferase [Limisphaerales bacterium]